MASDNLFDRLGSVLKDYIDNENLQKQNDLQKQNRANAGAKNAGTAEALSSGKNRSGQAGRTGQKHSEQKKGPEQQSRARGIVYKALSASLIEDFNILGLSPDADVQTCKKRYKQLLHLYHPDKYEAGTKEQDEANALTMRIHKAFKNIEKFKTRV